MARQVWPRVISERTFGTGAEVGVRPGRKIEFDSAVSDDSVLIGGCEIGCRMDWHLSCRF